MTSLQIRLRHENVTRVKELTKLNERDARTIESGAAKNDAAYREKLENAIGVRATQIATCQKVITEISGGTFDFTAIAEKSAEIQDREKQLRRQKTEQRKNEDFRRRQTEAWSSAAYRDDKFEQRQMANQYERMSRIIAEVPQHILSDIRHLPNSNFGIMYSGILFLGDAPAPRVPFGTPLPTCSRARGYVSPYPALDLRIVRPGGGKFRF
jgi:hypothetical protein